MNMRWVRFGFDNNSLYPVYDSLEVKRAMYSMQVVLYPFEKQLKQRTGVIRVEVIYRFDRILHNSNVESFQWTEVYKSNDCSNTFGFCTNLYVLWIKI